MKKQVFQQKYIKCEVSHKELWKYQFTFFHFKLYSELLFFTAKNCNSKIRLIVKLDLILDCNKIRLNVPLDRSITVIYHI